MPDNIRHLLIRGRVQGVGYRAFVMHAALTRGLEGWVRNRRDGSVEAVIAGAPDVIDEVIADCRRGPSAARVTAIETRDGSADELNLRRPGELFSGLPTL